MNSDRWSSYSPKFAVQLTVGEATYLFEVAAVLKDSKVLVAETSLGFIQTCKHFLWIIKKLIKKIINLEIKLTSPKMSPTIKFKWLNLSIII